jgi:DNA-binding Lrp family transcriptional regulator
MAANAYVMLSVEPAKTAEAVKRLSKIRGAIVREVTGPYDVIVELTADTTIDLTSIVRSKIRSIPGVTATITCLWMEGFMGHHAGGE